LSGLNITLAKTGPLAAALAAALLAGCSGRDTDSAERLAEINAAAARAEQAAERAEAAAAKVEKGGQGPVEEVEPAVEEPGGDEPAAADDSLPPEPDSKN